MYFFLGMDGFGYRPAVPHSAHCRHTPIHGVSLVVACLYTATTIQQCIQILEMYELMACNAIGIICIAFHGYNI